MNKKFPIRSKDTTLVAFMSGGHFIRRSCHFSKDDISKKIPPKVGSGLIFKGLRPETIEEYPVIIWENTIKPLKIRPSAMDPIDIVLRILAWLKSRSKLIGNRSFN